MSTTTQPCAVETCGHRQEDHARLMGCLVQTDGRFCTCAGYATPPVPVLPATPYDGGTSSGHSGTDTSAARAARRDGNGSTKRLQTRLVEYLDARGPDGATIVEVRAAFPNDHHGTLSGALSNLHKVAAVHMLDAKRDNARVYVHLRHVGGRRTIAPGATRVKRAKDTGPVTLTVEEADALRRIASKAARFQSNPNAPAVMAVSVSDAALVTAALNKRSRA